MNTAGILENCDPAAWRSHRFGLSEDRWRALEGRVVWVTGAGSGFGRSVAVALAMAGARPVLSGRRRAKLEESLGEMKAFGADPSQAIVACCDITVESELAEVLERVMSQTGRLDGLVSCAAVPIRGPAGAPLAAWSQTQWCEMMQTNVTAQWLTARTALPAMTATRAARMVFFTSEAGWAFTPGFGPYNMSKAALNNLAASFASEAEANHPSSDIQINVVNPGEARTEMNQGSETSPYAVVSMVLALLSHGPGGPNGRFFIRDGRHVDFAYAQPWPSPLL